jgi:hypothetical protein
MQLIVKIPFLPFVDNFALKIVRLRTFDEPDGKKWVFGIAQASAFIQKAKLSPDVSIISEF